MYQEEIAKERAHAGLMQAQGPRPSLAGAAGGLAQADVPKRSPDMQIAVEAASERIDVLLKEIEILGSRLSGILRQENTSANAAGAPPPQFSGCTGVTQAIASVTNRIEAGIYHVRMLLDLLEL